MIKKDFKQHVPVCVCLFSSVFFFELIPNSNLKTAGDRLGNCKGKHVGRGAFEKTRWCFREVCFYFFSWDFPGVFFGFPKIFLGFSQGFPRGFYGFLWFFPGFSMVFLGFS